MGMFGMPTALATAPSRGSFYAEPQEDWQLLSRPGNLPGLPQGPGGMFGAPHSGGVTEDGSSRLGGILSQALQQPSLLGAPGGLNSTAADAASGGALLRNPTSDTPSLSGEEARHQNPLGAALAKVAGSPIANGPETIAPQLPAIIGADFRGVRVKPHFFDKEGTGTKILKGLGEFALRYSASQGDPFALMTLRGRLEQQQAQTQLLQQVKERQAERDEWVWREQWKRQNPDDQFTQYMRAAGIDPASPQGQALYRQRAESIAAPPVVAVDGYDAQGNLTKTFMPRTGLGTPGQPASSGPPTGTVRNGYRFTGGNPNDRNSWVPVGGASPAGGATFR